jgi:hypothetical protein
VTNKAAQQHIDKAKEYARRGESLYSSAVDEILAAQKADPTLGYREIGQAMGRSKEWVRTLVLWHTSGTDRAPYATDSMARPQRAAKQMLRDADDDKIDDLTAGLTPTQAAKLAASADKVVQEHGRKQRAQSDANRREAVGVDADDDLAAEQKVHDAEAELFKARRALRDAVALFSEVRVSDVRESWTEDLLKTLTDLQERIEMCRVLLQGGTVNDEELAELLGRE